MMPGRFAGRLVRHSMGKMASCAAIGKGASTRHLRRQVKWNNAGLNISTQHPNNYRYPPSVFHRCQIATVKKIRIQLSLWSQFLRKIKTMSHALHCRGMFY
jgi:hypothetical protein